RIPPAGSRLLGFRPWRRAKSAASTASTVTSFTSGDDAGMAHLVDVFWPHRAPTSGIDNDLDTPELRLRGASTMTSRRTASWRSRHSSVMLCVASPARPVDHIDGPLRECYSPTGRYAPRVGVFSSARWA